MVAKHDGRFLTQDKAALAARILNQVREAAEDPQQFPDGMLAENSDSKDAGSNHSYGIVFSLPSGLLTGPFSRNFTVIFGAPIGRQTDTRALTTAKIQKPDAPRFKAGLHLSHRFQLDVFLQLNFGDSARAHARESSNFLAANSQCRPRGAQQIGWHIHASLYGAESPNARTSTIW